MMGKRDVRLYAVCPWWWPKHWRGLTGREKRAFARRARAFSRRACSRDMNEG